MCGKRIGMRKKGGRGGREKMKKFLSIGSIRRTATERGARDVGRLKT